MLEAPASPELTWRPSRYAVIAGLVLATVASVAFIPWWTVRPLLGLSLAFGAAAAAVCFGVTVKRESRVLDAYVRFRAVRTGDATIRGLTPQPGFVFVPQAVFLIPGAVMVSLLYSAASGTQAPPIADLALVVLGLAYPAVGLALSWRSPWFRVQWYLMMATWCSAGTRSTYLGKAAANDPTLRDDVDMSNKRIEPTAQAPYHAKDA